MTKTSVEYAYKIKNGPNLLEVYRERNRKKSLAYYYKHKNDPTFQNKRRQHRRMYYLKNREKLLERSKQWQRENIERRRAHWRNFYHRNQRKWNGTFWFFKKQQVIREMGGCCQHCGITDTEVLDLHHINRREKRADWKSPREREKMIVLCANCHRKVHYSMFRKRWEERMLDSDLS